MEKPDWVLLIRRSLGVPDLISDSVALDFMGNAAMTTVSAEILKADYGTNQDRRAEATRVLIDAIATAGSEGTLDTFLVAGGEEAFESAVISVTSGGHGSASTVDATKHVLERIEHFVSTHKFRADCGCYFN